jgi:hypothetical protein
MVAPPKRVSREIRSARISRRPPSLAVTLVALAVVFALAWMFFLRSGPSASAPLVKGVRGTYTWEPIVPGAAAVPREAGSFSAVASGDAGGRMTWENSAPRAGTSGSAESAYDAAGRVTTTVTARSTRLGERTGQSRTVGVWPPAWRVDTRSPLDYQGLAAIVRTAVEDGDEAVGIKPVKDGERAAWRAAMTLDGKDVNVVVDQQTGLVTWYSDGEVTFTAAVDWDAPPPSDTTYSVDAPASTQVETVGDAQAYEQSAAAAGRSAGYRPLVSDLAPDGYAVRAVATTAAELRPVSWISDQVWSLPVGLPGTAIMQLYTRGLSQFTVEQVGPATMRALARGPDWRADAQPGKLSPEETTLQYGTLKGATAFTWYQESGPSLLVSDARRAVYVTGALTRQELIAFAEGLRPVGANAER